jgi:hypothetical protein
VAYSATAINVMIASPSDVPQERVIIRQVIAEWNSIHAKDRKTVLMPVGWETHAVPDTGDRPQSIINGQLLKDADLLIAVFWTRIGSPTGAAQSGTVEEIEEHIKAGKSAMIYFSSAPVRPDSIDAGQYSALIDFKQSIRARGLCVEYESLSDFQAKLTRQLAQKIISQFPNDSLLSVIPIPVSVATPSLPDISASAGDLLIEASSDRQGAVMGIQSMGGYSVQTNNRSFVEGGDVRSEAQWRRAVAELANAGLIEDRAGTREVFFVTDDGYRVADLLKQQ